MEKAVRARATSVEKAAQTGPVEKESDELWREGVLAAERIAGGKKRAARQRTVEKVRRRQY